MECRLKQSKGDWRCQVRLRRKRDTDISAHPKAVADFDVEKKAREENFGPLLTDKSELERMIRRAQLAILNPSLSASRFLEKTEDEIDEGYTSQKGQKGFSPDVICLDIESPDVINLSFIDLPGKFLCIISSSIRSFDSQGSLLMILRRKITFNSSRTWRRST